MSRVAQRFHEDQQGQLIFIGMFGAFGFVFILALFLNMSANLHEKMRMQAAADAACLAAAQEIADGMNTISDNNVAITEFVALKSLSEAMVPMAEALFESHDATYNELLEAMEDSPDLFPLKEQYRKARNLEELIINNSSYFNNTVPGNCSSAISAMMSDNRSITASAPKAAVQAADNVARQNGARGAIIAGPTHESDSSYPLHIPAFEGEGGAQDWESPTVYGSQSGSGDSNRRGYHYLYSLREDDYALGEGPFTAWLDRVNIEKIEAISGRGPLEGEAYVHLYENLDDLDPAWTLYDFESAYEELGIVVVAYGKSRPAVLVAGSGSRNLSPFSRRLSGFDQPQDLGTVTVAQAQVFNPVSWDLSTQYWDIKLTRVKKLPDVSDETTAPLLQQSGATGRGIYH
ncbi:MAG: hypothetical protein AMXMBFR82_23650 [Candidatus Hydrogenedentota bacterium]